VATPRFARAARRCSTTASTASFLLAGKTVGLVGCGNLARSLLPLLRPFGCELLAHDPWLPDEAVSALGVEPVALLDLFARSKVVFILSP
jgi:phosphoglycerate dehydrogenase-like enzyme